MAFNRLCLKLNRQIDNDYIKISSDSIRSEMSELRDCIVTLICLHDERDGIECINIDVCEFDPDIEEDYNSRKL